MMTPAIRIVPLLFFVLTATTAIAQTELYLENFDSPKALTEWSTSVTDPLWQNPIKTDVTPTGGRRFLGQFGRQTVRLSLDNLPPHDSLTVIFSLFVIRSWDGDDEPHSDTFRLEAPGSDLYWCATFTNFDFLTQTYPGLCGSQPGTAMQGAAERFTLGYQYLPHGQRSSVYRLVISFPHTDDSLRLDFIGALNEGMVEYRNLDNESWGLDDVSVEASGARAEAVVEMTFDTLSCGSTVLDTVWVRSTGNAALRLDSMRIGGNPVNFSMLSPTLPLTVPPGESVQIIVQFEGTAPGGYRGALLLYNNTPVNPLAVVLNGWIQPGRPSATVEDEQCSVHAVSIADVCGLDSIALGPGSDNVVIEFEPPPPAQSVRVRVRPVDPSKPGRYVLLANGVVVRDGVIESAHVLDVPAGVQAPAFGADGCGTVQVYNRGTKGVWVDAATMRHNVQFSVPPSQLPLWIPAGESRALVVCYRSGAGSDRDTLDLATACHDVAIALSGPARVGFTGEGLDCGTVFGLRPLRAGKRAVLAHAPIVERDGSALSILIEGAFASGAEDFAVSVVVYDMLGRRACIASPGIAAVTMRNGVREERCTYRADLSGCPQGAYMVVVATPDGPALHPFLLAR